MFKALQGTLTAAAGPQIDKYAGQAVTAVLTFTHTGLSETVYVGISIAYEKRFAGLPVPNMHNDPFLHIYKQVTVTNDVSAKTYEITVTDNLPANTKNDNLDTYKFISKSVPVVGHTPSDDYNRNNWDDDTYDVHGSLNFIELLSATPYVGDTPPLIPGKTTLPLKATSEGKAGALFLLKNTAPNGTSPITIRLRIDLRKEGDVNGWNVVLFGVGALLGLVTTWQEGDWFDAGELQPQQTLQVALCRKVPKDWQNANIDMQLLLYGKEGEIWSQNNTFIVGAGTGGGGGLGDISSMISSLLSLMIMMMMMQMITPMLSGLDSGSSSPKQPKQPKPSKDKQLDIPKLIESGVKTGVTIAALIPK
jgi:hypothetical protein